MSRCALAHGLATSSRTIAVTNSHCLLDRVSIEVAQCTGVANEAVRAHVVLMIHSVRLVISTLGLVISTLAALSRVARHTATPRYRTCRVQGTAGA